MKAFTLCFYLLVNISYNTVAQSADHSPYLIKFKDVPIELLRHNRKKIFSRSEFANLIDRKMIPLTVEIDPDLQNILSVSYDSVNYEVNRILEVKQLDSKVISKLKDFFMRELEIESLIKLEGYSSVEGNLEFFFVLEFGRKDIRSLLRW